MVPTGPRIPPGPRGAALRREGPTAKDFLSQPPNRQNTSSPTNSHSNQQMADSYRRGRSPVRGAWERPSEYRFTSDRIHPASRSSRSPDRDRGGGSRYSSNRFDDRDRPYENSYRPIYDSPPPIRGANLQETRGKVSLRYNICLTLRILYTWISSPAHSITAVQNTSPDLMWLMWK
ncbi:hypothetical protein M430DRAFT_185366 [Amorphotheca resinae ATCC 22711]|jgi:hypothetical protein|uniref:Uncharacterized protein n=1 Tax=Amorphotheca resinae ATCC 22711 TaxID=857342 RepID=A0A2T3ASF9_AMORE|nr:hypothetical protein M430DRAFT_185366 [Amorphotheca resinae ATCC 22711]PSS09310.1 hypothetical protein M430DRAFT_185366 [Amorphotheca resinae ATCC 22711]